jgi:glycosyltransferase involved in cell wall biosynthesis
MITGVGSALGGGEGLARRLLSLTMRLLYRIALRGAHVLFFQNDDDVALFRGHDLLGRATRLVRIAGSGVDLDHYAQAPPPPASPITFLMICRLIADKGVREYVAAARMARGRLPEARFWLLGPLDPNPTAIGREELDAWIDEGVIDYLGATDDVRPQLAETHVYVLPSYREGMPRSVLEAMSVGRAILTTDAPGCRDTTVPGENGYLVPVRDVKALAEQMVAMAADPDALAAMGRRSRQMAEERFDVRGVNRTIMEALGLARAPETKE